MTQAVRAVKALSRESAAASKKVDRLRAADMRKSTAASRRALTAAVNIRRELRAELADARKVQAAARSAASEARAANKLQVDLDHARSSAEDKVMKARAKAEAKKARRGKRKKRKTRKAK